MIVSIDTKETSDRTQCLFEIKKYLKITYRRLYLQTVELLYDNLISNTVLNRRKQEAFTFRAGLRGKRALFPLLSNVLWEFSLGKRKT